MNNFEPKIIALYLPQYHPTANNDIWWGKGFTEWTNVGKAKPLFKGHYQPKVPADLGYYDLRLPQIREEQAKLAKEAGVYGFCYYHYWFGNGRQELELPFNEVLNLGKPDFPFCLCWANESWHSKFWNLDGTIHKKCLVEQIYDDKEGHKKHFLHLLPAFKDERYIKIDGKPLFMIYQPFLFDDIERFINQWNQLAIDYGFPGIHFVAHLFLNVNQKNIDKLNNMGFNAVNSLGLHIAMNGIHQTLGTIQMKLNSILGKLKRAVKYSKAYPLFLQEVDKKENVYPTLIPNWDHTPRSGRAGTVLVDSTPILFKKHCIETFEIVRKKRIENQIIFIKSWNEWGEGNYMEPDLKYGKGYIEALRSAIDEMNK